MLDHMAPATTFDEPAMVGWLGIPSTVAAFVQEWRYDVDHTRYRAVVVYAPATERVLVAIDPDEYMGRTWWAFDWKPGELLSADYVAEKWRVKHDNIPHLLRLLSVALSRPPIYEGAHE